MLSCRQEGKRKKEEAKDGGKNFGGWRAETAIMDFPKQRIILKELIPADLYLHSLGVAHTAYILAAHYGVNRREAYTAGLWHDYAKPCEAGDLLKKAAEINLDLDEITIMAGPVLHAFVGAAMLEKPGQPDNPELSGTGPASGVQTQQDKKNSSNFSNSLCSYFSRERLFNRSILNAVKLHTTGGPGMSMLEKIVYLADSIEPERDYPGVEEIRRAAFTDLNTALLKVLDNALRKVISRGNVIHPYTIAFRNELIKNSLKV